MDQPPARSRDRRQRRRRAAVTNLVGSHGDPVPGTATAGATTSSGPRHRRHRRRPDRNAAAAPAAEAAEALEKSETLVRDVISTHGDSVLQTDCPSEAAAADLPQSKAEKIVDSYKTRDRNFQPGNKAKKVSAEDGVNKSDLRVIYPHDSCTGLGYGYTNVDYQNKVPNCPEMKNTKLSENSEEAYQKKMSCGCSSLQEENEPRTSLNSNNLEKKKRRKKRGGKRHNRCRNTSTEDSPLPAGTDNSSVVIMTSENINTCIEPEEPRKKQDQNKVYITNSVVNAKTREEDSVNLSSAIKKYGELGRNYLESTNIEKNELQEQEIVCLSKVDNVNCPSPPSLAETYMQKFNIFSSHIQPFGGFPKKKLLVLDLNGLLADINQDYHNAYMADAKVRGKLVFRRPYCDDFLNFCAQNFEIGIWSSRKRENVDSVVNIIMRDFKPRLLFCWDMSKCTFTGYKTLENMHKPLVLKELKKLWNKEETDLPWEDGEYSSSNTLLVDDSPYKALCNPPHTAIFPRPYSYLNQNDNSLGPGGDLRLYLQNLASADDVECYVRNNRFGQPFIAESDPHWNFYAQIADKRCSPLTTCA